MLKNFRLSYAIILLFLMSIAAGCGGSKETVSYEPPPDPFPKPEEEVFTSGPRNETFKAEENEAAAEDIDKTEPFILLTVNFEFDQSRLTDEAKAILAQNARRLQERPDTNIRIEGHCDERGTVEYNLALGERRALAVRNYLINFGVAANRMTLISYGKERPLDPRHTPAAWSANRRAEFVILN